MSNKIFISDGNNWAHRSFHAMKNLSYAGKPSGGIFGFLNILGGNVSKFKPKKIFVCWDDGRNKHRMKLLPNYKNRVQKLDMDYENFHSQKEVIQKLMYYLGIPQLVYPNREADDFIYSLVKKHSKDPNNRIVIGSGDKDFRQLVTNRIIIHDENKGLITPLNFRKLFNLLPYQYADYLSLCGDDSDKIPGVPGFGEKTTLDFLHTYGSVKGYLNQPIKIKKDELLRSTYSINNRLINLEHFDMVYGPFKLRYFKDNKKPKPNIEKYKKLCAKYGIKKFTTKEYLAKII